MIIVLCLVIPMQDRRSSIEAIDILTDAITRYVYLDGGGLVFFSLRQKDDRRRRPRFFLIKTNGRYNISGLVMGGISWQLGNV